MKKSLLIQKLNFVIIFFVMMFSYFVCQFGESKAFAVDANLPAQTNSAKIPVSAPVVQDTESTKTITERNSEVISKLKKGGVHSPLVKFLLAMLGVLISSMSIFFGLKIYQKLVLKKIVKQDSIDYTKNLETPKDFKEAINLFLNKTEKH